MKYAIVVCIFIESVAVHGRPPAAEPVREMDTDRPDTTESAFSVPRGWWQVEAEMLSATRDGGHWSYDWGSLNLKYGLTDFVDLQWVTPAWHDEDGLDGWTDSEVRLKWNLSGQREGDAWALALMPWVKLPVASRGLGNDDWEGGLIVPMALTESSFCDFAWMLQADVLRTEDDDGWTGAFTASATAGFDLTSRLGAFTEVMVTAPLEGSAEVYLNGGLIFSVNENWRIDAGVNAGLNRAATDVRLFAGTSFRF